ncbi:MAG: PASTA domain-containing protein, partial [Acidobacteriaceae bacterium]|nr:PASTA domain-containing protein [Acidobacteriaceae bacterium]
LGLWAFIIGIRLLQLQVFDYGELTQRAQRQQQRTIEVEPRRGVIYDRSGHELAMSVSVDSIFAVPSEIPDQATTASILSKVLKADPHEILARMKASHAFCWVARKVDSEMSDRVRRLQLRGIYFQKEPKRFYPKRELAAQVLGYVGVDDNGLGGIERAYEEHLKGRPGKMLISMDAKRRWFGRVERQPEPGQNLVLTIDEHIQYIAERELETAMKDTHAIAATIIVQNPKTGEILALANRPTFNPNLFNKVPAEALKNRAVSDVYEPGSTFKIVTVAGALEEKLTRPDEMIDCQMGAIVIAGMRIRDHELFGVIPVSDIIAKSSDVGAIKLGLRLGDERFDHYIRGFGFGAQTGIELPGETRGLAKPVNRWSKVSIGAISMGQEIGISAVQLAQLLSTIANDGVWIAPHILADPALHNVSQKTSDGAVMAQQRRVISPLTAAQMKQMLEGVVQRGTGRKAQLEGYSSAGKTGTAQKVDPTTGAYSKSKYVGSFAGFAPVNNPALTVVVIIDSAVGLHQGGQVAAPVFQRVMQESLEYLNVQHDMELRNPARTTLLAGVRESDLSETSPDRLAGSLDVNEPPASPVARAKPVDTVTAQPVPELKTASLTSPPPTGTVVDVEGVPVPRLIGKSVRQAIELAQESGLDIEVIGNGVAREQTPAPGLRIPLGSRIAVRFMP